MAKKRRTTLHVAPLQRVVAEEITDPAEIAAIDRARKRIMARRARNGIPPGVYEEIALRPPKRKRT
jgi:hypothetical protein